MMHLSLTFASWIATVGASESLAGFLRLGSAYLQFTHFGLDDTPVYVAKGTTDEQSRMLVIGTEDFAEVEPLMEPCRAGLGADDRQQRWLGVIDTLVQGDQSSLVAELMRPILPTDVRQGATVSLLKEPNLMSTFEDDESPPTYQARVLVGDDKEISLVQLRESRLTAAANP